MNSELAAMSGHKGYLETKSRLQGVPSRDQTIFTRVTWIPKMDHLGVHAFRATLDLDNLMPV